MPRSYEVTPADLPLPWKVEEDWAYEVVAANGRKVCSTPFGVIARFIVNAAGKAAAEDDELIRAWLGRN